MTGGAPKIEFPRINYSARGTRPGAGKKIWMQVFTGYEGALYPDGTRERSFTSMPNLSTKLESRYNRNVTKLNCGPAGNSSRPGLWFVIIYSKLRQTPHDTGTNCTAVFLISHLNTHLSLGLTALLLLPFLPLSVYPSPGTLRIPLGFPSRPLPAPHFPPNN